ncbi:hypothetical protein Rhow_008966 [Rhodococcus wratislaviensis]|uniref:Uncharacterized protein n=1 Tax=Rhodococcus wratislaviensis TaxID=44752 RepID=A0A402CLX7_RHOWR|nr:hypothetical protein Rhow_008966 [Rhodococcus wratislaviensis]
MTLRYATLASPTLREQIDAGGFDRGVPGLGLDVRRASGHLAGSFV